LAENGFKALQAAKPAGAAGGIRVFIPARRPNYRVAFKMGFVGEFMDFIKKYQVIGLAVAFVIGAAATKLVTATVNDLVMPVIAVLVPGGDWREATLALGPAVLKIGDFAGAAIDFTIIALVIFVVVKYAMKDEAALKK
jgi:large conductance mechanosensitive channel